MSWTILPLSNGSWGVVKSDPRFTLRTLFEKTSLLSSPQNSTLTNGRRACSTLRPSVPSPVKQCRQAAPNQKPYLTKTTPTWTILMVRRSLVINIICQWLALNKPLSSNLSSNNCIRLRWKIHQHPWARTKCLTQVNRTSRCSTTKPRIS